MKTILFCVCGAFFLLSPTAHAGDPYPGLPTDYSRVVSAWQAVTLDPDPPRGGVRGAQMPFGGVDWRVYFENNQIIAEPSSNRFQKRRPVPPFHPTWPGHTPEESEDWIAVAVADGWIVSFDLGEWGGALVWFNSDGSKSKQISEGVASSFLTTPDGIFAEGAIPAFEHAMFKLERADGHHWRLRRLFVITEAPAYIGWLGNDTLIFFSRRKMHSYSSVDGVKPFRDNLLPPQATVTVNESTLSCGGRYAFSVDKIFTAGEGVVRETDLHTATTRCLVPDSRFINDELKHTVSVLAKYYPEYF